MVILTVIKSPTLKTYLIFTALISALLVIILSETAPAIVPSLQRPQPVSCGPPGFNNYDSPDAIATNDNRMPAGTFRDGIYYIDLETRTGNWFPETKEAASLPVYAFAEKGKPMQIPGPLIRVPRGTEIHASITNNIKEHALVLHGFYSRPGNINDSVVIAPGETKTIQFNAGIAGTYFYKGSASELTIDGLPFREDSQLYGALIVDEPNQKIDTAERIFMVGIWNDTLNGTITSDREELVLNGLSWPFTERLTYNQHKPVNWRIINASNQEHPMHLHGFYYTVKSRGSINNDVIYSKEDREKEVTQLLTLGKTMTITWIPERDGNWLFHCHTLVHIMPVSFLRKMPDFNGMDMNNLATHAHDGMGGLIMGIHVNPDGKALPTLPEKGVPERQLTLIVGSKANYIDTFNGKGFMLLENGKPIPTEYSIPGPPIILHKDEPVAIKVINKLNEPTTIHWHGMEIESYYDGVAGWGYRGNLLAPLVEPGDSFTVHMKPSSTGTFMYHTHMHNFQGIEGMEGSLIVLNKGETFHPETDKVFLFTSANDFNTLLLNGKYKTDTMQLKAGTNYRFRFMNLTAYWALLNVSLLHDSKPVQWRFISKDGNDLTLQHRVTEPAFEQTISIGETRDFQFNPTVPGNYAFVAHIGYGFPDITKVLAVK